MLGLVGEKPAVARQRSAARGPQVVLVQRREQLVSANDAEDDLQRPAVLVGQPLVAAVARQRNVAALDGLARVADAQRTADGRSKLDDARFAAARAGRLGQHVLAAALDQERRREQRPEPGVAPAGDEERKAVGHVVT